MAQSLKAVKIDGVISIIGFLGADAKTEQPGFLETLVNICTVRGLLVGSRVQFEEMVSHVFIFPPLPSLIIRIRLLSKHHCSWRIEDSS